MDSWKIIPVVWGITGYQMATLDQKQCNVHSRVETVAEKNLRRAAERQDRSWVPPSANPANQYNNVQGQVGIAVHSTALR